MKLLDRDPNVNNEAVLKTLFKSKDTEMNTDLAVKVAIETEDATKVAKETVYYFKTTFFNKVKHNQNEGQRKSISSLIPRTLNMTVTDVEIIINNRLL